MFSLCFYISARTFRNKSPVGLKLLGIATGILIDIRIPGILFFLLTALVLIADVVIERRVNGLRKGIKYLILYMFSAVLTTYAFWPYLRPDPIDHFANAFRNMSRFRWEGLIVFNGAHFPATEEPWYYIPEWMAISIPEVYIVCTIIGLVILIRSVIKKPMNFFSDNLQRNYLIYLSCFAIPLVSVWAFHSVLYDDWRQLYFIYPAAVLISLYGLNYLLSQNFKWIVVFIYGEAILLVGWNMIVNFPHNQMYFNHFINTSRSERLRQRFELNYWGLSYKMALEYILKHDSSKVIRIFSDHQPAFFNYLFLSDEKRRRMHFTETRDSADYYLTNYRHHPGNYEALEGRKWHSVVMMNSSINTIYKLK